MPAPRPSYSAESAKDAALQAEFNEKKWVWAPDEKEGYLAGWVINEDGEEGDVVLAGGGECKRFPLMMLSKMNPPKFDRVDDIADLTFLNEASVVHNLRLRYGSGAIYTYSGLFLVAINPYTNLPLYSDAVIQQYRAKRRDENPPHIFAIAERAWVSMGEERENQSVLITGESGAGKTENTKKVIQYLAAIATDSLGAPSHSRSPSIASIPSSGSFSALPSSIRPRTTSFKRSHRAANQSVSTRASLGLLERQILQANPILEAFGNAQTQRNNNSSRFGKFVRISFSTDGSIAGANIDWYLLEKSRVTARSDAERSFHVFYQLLDGSDSLRTALLLGDDPLEYEYLNRSRTQIDGVDDREEWRSLKTALDIVGFTNEEQLDLFRIVAAILHIGNIEITEDRSNQAQIRNPPQVEKVCHLLGLPVQEFTKAVLRPRVLAGREWVTQARTKQQALDELSALCKTIYEKSFGALVDRINKALDRPSTKSTFIGVLDIAGFEIFTENGFEQLCINYTNEKLQQFFNHHMFVLEQEEYQREGIDWNFVNFGLDLQPTIDLIESREPIGVLSCLDEECIMPKANDGTFTQKLHSLWAPPNPDPDTVHPGVFKYTAARFEQGFIIQHYAGKVEYRTDGWLEKNKDPLNDNVTRVMAASSERYVAQLFNEYGVGQEGSGFIKKRVKKGAFRTVAQRHKEQLSSLMTQLKATQPHFVRCIVPNAFKKPGRVDVPLVLDQLRCNGVLEGIRIARLGYPNRLPFAEFRHRYEVLTPGIIPRGYMDGRKACTRIIDALELDEGVFKIGTSKVFFRAGVLAELEERRDRLLHEIFSKVQAAARRWTARRQMKKILNRAVAIRTIQRNARVYGELREWPWWQLYTKIRPMLAATRNDEELKRKEVELALVRERAERDKKEKAALEALKMQLEQAKRKVEDDLQAERNLAIDKDKIIERSKAREAELEEDIVTLQADIDTLESQLDRAVEAQKATEAKYAKLKEAFDQAAEHLVNLEQEEKGWKVREAALVKETRQRDDDGLVLQAIKEELEKEAEDLKRVLKEREEDLSIVKERMETAVTDLEQKLTAEVKARDSNKSKADSLEEEVRHAKDQLSELAQNASDYESMIQKKEADIVRITSELGTFRRQMEAARKQNVELQAQMNTLTTELETQKHDKDRTGRERSKLQAELDELRSLMAAKTDEETKRNEVEKSKEAELANLRSQVDTLQRDLAEARLSAAEKQNSLQVELDDIKRQHDSVSKSYQEAAAEAKANEERLSEIEVGLVNSEKAKRVAESELQSVKSKQIDMDGQVAEATKAKEGLERQLAAALTKQQDFEDALLQIERDKASWARHMDAVRKQLETEMDKRTQLENDAKAGASELAKHKDMRVKLERELKKVQNDLQQREGEVISLRSKQDKTIVEHVHVLQEAKAFTDRQLAEAQVEVERQKVYIKSLEKTKTRLIVDAEDLTRETERERQELRAKEKAAKAQEEKMMRAQTAMEQERKLRESAELRARRTQDDVAVLQSQLEDVTNQMKSVERSKANLEVELASLAADGDSKNANAKLRSQYEARIAQLEGQADEAANARATAERIKQRIDRQHAELRRLIAGSNPRDDSFRERLLRELEAVDQEVEREMTLRSTPRKQRDDMRHYANVTPSKTREVNGSGYRAPPAEPPRTPDRQATNQLRQQVQILELQMAASHRVRQHLEASLRDIMFDLENSDGSKQSLQSHRSKLARENARLADLIEEESRARRTAESAQINGIQAMWDKFQNTINEERESYTKLEDSRKALLAQQRSGQVEVEDHRRQVSELLQSKKELQNQVSELRDQLQIELLAKNEEANSRKALQMQLQELELTSHASSSIHKEIKEAMEAAKAKSDAYLGRLEAADLAKAKAVRSESLARRALADAEKAAADAVAERQAVEARLAATEQRLRDVEKKLEEEGREVADAELLSRRLAEEMEGERDQYQKDLSDRDFTINQTRKKYQTELAQLSEEIQAQRDGLSALREENRKIRSERDDLQLQFDDEVYNGGAWKKEKERLENKIADLTTAREKALAKNSEQQSQIFSYLSQIRELRRVQEESEMERSSLLKARQTLQSQLQDIEQQHVDAHKMSSEGAIDALYLEKQELRSALEEHSEKLALATQKRKKAEQYASECQSELEKISRENSELDKANAALEKAVKDLNVHIVDLETKSYARTPPSTNSKRLEAKIQELTSQLHQESKEKGDTIRVAKSADKSLKDIQYQLAECERMRIRAEDEIRKSDSRVEAMKQAFDELQTSESTLRLDNRKFEREATEYKQRSAMLEAELERLKSRLEHPSMLARSPRKS